MRPLTHGDDEGLSSTTQRETVIARLEDSPHLHSHLPHLSLPPTLSLLPLPPTTQVLTYVKALTTAGLSAEEAAA